MCTFDELINRLMKTLTTLFCGLFFSLVVSAQYYDITSYTDYKHTEQVKGSILIEYSKMYIVVGRETNLVYYEEDTSVILFNKSTEVEGWMDGRYCRIIRNYGDLKYIIFVFSNGDRVRYNID